MATGKTYNSVDSKEQLRLVQTGRGKFGGYKQDLLVNTLNEMEIEFYVCTQCKGVMRNACQVGEEQICVCEMCTERSMMKASPMLKARQKIPQLKANCPLTTRGCQWNGTLSEIETHLNVCQEFVVKCENDCGVILRRCELNNHCSNECLSREASCEHCLNKTEYRDLKRHYEACLEFPLLCPNSCGANLRRKQTDSHIETDCPNTVVRCPHERFGCKEVIKRCEMEEHNKTKEIKHLAITTLFAVAKIEQSEETITKLLKEADKLTDKLEQSDRRTEELERQSVITTESLECWKKEREKENNLKLDAEKQSEERITKLLKEVNRLTDKLEQSDIKMITILQRIENLERQAMATTESLKERANINNPTKEIEKQSPIIDSLTYPVVLRDRIMKIEFEQMRITTYGIYGLTRNFCRFEITWHNINLILLFGISSRETISVYINIVSMPPLAKRPFEGRFKLTIIDRVNTNNSLVYESLVVKLQPTPRPEQGFNLKERHPNKLEIATIPKDLLREDRFSSEKGELEFTLQIQKLNI